MASKTKNPMSTNMNKKQGLHHFKLQLFLDRTGIYSTQARYIYTKSTKTLEQLSHPTPLYNLQTKNQTTINISIHRDKDNSISNNNHSAEKPLPVLFNLP